MSPPAQGQLHDVISSVTSKAGYDLEELTITPAGRRSVLRVVIDSDHGVSLDDAAGVSRTISDLLDALQSAQSDEPGQPTLLPPTPYTLEVTSPGVGRPLTQARHFRRARGRLLALSLADGTSLTARVLAVRGEEIDLLVGETDVQIRTVAVADVSRARVEVEFSAPPAAVVAALAQAVDGAPAGDAEPARGPHSADPTGRGEGA